MSEPNDRSADDMASENGPIVSEEQSEISGVDLENLSVPNEVASEDPTATNVLSTRSELGLLSLPAELRVLIFRHLLLEHRPLSTYWAGSGYQPFPAIFETCALIRREAFHVMYEENVFFISFTHPRSSILNNRQISDTIQNVHVEAYLTHPFPQPRRLNFIHAIREFGSPAIIRGTLHVIYHVGCHHNPVHLLAWFAAGLGRFTNFRTIRIEFVDRSPPVEGICTVLAEIHEETFTPILGPAQFFADGRGVEFHPVDYLNSLPPVVDVDWMENLDGIRQTWD
ncbi:hypothetical protein MMC22_011096 [Lobaria immixta]|nr:hypothetical protein [Lobaria immixta]